MQTRTRDSFTTVRTEGGLLPPDIMHRILDPRDKDVPGKSPDSYHLAQSERINEVAARAWTRLVGAWSAFRAKTETLADDDLGTTPTREQWLLILFQELAYGRLPTAGKATELEGKTYPISHLWGSSPIHLVGFRVDLDRRSAGVAGAARTSPHSLVQEFLNRSDDHLWGFVSNGLRLRILRDNVSMTRQSYVEFDLESMMDGEVYSDFVLLWMLCHQSRVESEVPEECWLEKWTQTAKERGTRALEGLRQGVEDAITALGAGFLAHSGNHKLKERLRSGELATQEYYHQVLRLVYRLLFLFVAEDRSLLLSPDANPRSRDLYLVHHSMSRLRRLAESRRGTRHYDLYRGLQVVMKSLGNDKGCPELGLPVLGSFLWSDDAIPDLSSADIANRDVLSAIRELSLTEEGGLRRQVDYKNLGPEELGSVYESLLELHPDIDVDAAGFKLDVAAGHERKSTGSYYTPESLVRCLLDSALDPVLDEAVAKNDAENALLSLRICDPACGSGHFLLAAAHRVARRLAAVRTGEEEPSLDATRTAVRDVIGHCLYGVDLNPMAVELCKVALWMEALTPGMPLSFLDHRIQCGNSLLGTTLALTEKGIPDDAFKPIEGDEKALAGALKKQNREERRGQTSLFTGLIAESKTTYADLTEALEKLDELDDTSIRGVHRKEERYREFTATEDFTNAKLIADAWCAAFVWRKSKEAPPAITHDAFIRLREDPDSVSDVVRREISRLAARHSFLHWDLAFSDVLRPCEHEGSNSGGSPLGGGFDVVLGNPPWERIKLQEKEFFRNRNSEIADESNSAKRTRLIAKLESSDTRLYACFVDARDKALREKGFLRESGAFPTTAVGDINTCGLFPELSLRLLRSSGRVGMITQTQLVTEKTYSAFLKRILQERALVSCYAFENERNLFPGAHHSTRFILLTMGGTNEQFECATGLWVPEWLSDEQRIYHLSFADVLMLSPETASIPQFRTKRDADIAKRLHLTHPPLKNSDSSRRGIRVSRVMHDKDDAEVMTWDRAHAEENGFLPILESKLLEQYNHRLATYDGVTAEDIRKGYPRALPLESLSSPFEAVVPRKWVRVEDTPARFREFGDGWQLHVRKITNSIAIRTVVCSVTPKHPNNGSCAWIRNDAFRPEDYAVLLGVLNSLTFDYLARQKVGGINLNAYHLYQLPVPSLPSEGGEDWHREVSRRCLELTYTSWDVESFASSLGHVDSHGQVLPPFRWDPARRMLLRCEIEVFVAGAFGVTRDELDWLLDAQYPSESFRVLKNSEIREYGEYRTKRMILEIHDEMAEAIETGRTYQTRLDPPPADPRVAHRPRSRAGRE